jgi:gas vesicle protein
MLQAISIAIFEFSISANLGATHTDILRALAYLVHEVDKDIDTGNIITKIQDLMGGSIAALEEKVDQLEDTTKKQKEEIEKVIGEVSEKIKESTEKLGKTVEKAETISTAQTQISQQTTHTQGSDGPKSYAAATKSNIVFSLKKILAKNEAQARQIMIDRRSPIHVNSLRELTEAQLVAKATLAIELMEKEGANIPKDLNFISARRLPHGGVLYELNSPEMVKWFNSPANRSQFLEHFGPEITIKDRSFPVLIENVPTSFVPDNKYALAEIEKKAGLKTGAITKARYIKPESRRRPGQRTAHAILTFSTKEDANQAIKFGLSVESKKVYGRKLIAEPTRCLKCHSLEGSHIATECPQEHDTCGTCGKEHRTATCQVTNPNDYHCKNCDVKGHASWNRECPSFKSKWEAHKRRNEDAKYRFYITEDPLTWETQTDKDQELNEVPEQAHRHSAQQQSQPRYPPPRDRSDEWQTVNRQRNAQQARNTQNPNLVPIGGQSRIPDTWFTNSRQQASQRQTRETTPESANADHTAPSQWSQSPYGSPYDQYNSGGWDQDHAGN